MILKKTPVTIPHKESKSLGKILSHFVGKTINCRMIMNWPTTGKSCTSGAQDGEVHLNSKKLSSLVVSNLRSETKGSWSESGCYLFEEVSSLQ